MIINQTRNAVLATHLEVADTADTRMRGLLKRTHLAENEGLMIRPCSSVHMMFMRFAIDVVFLSKNNHVVGLCPNLKPYQFSPIFFNSCCAIELPAGKIEATKTLKGDVIAIQ